MYSIRKKSYKISSMIMSIIIFLSVSSNAIFAETLDISSVPQKSEEELKISVMKPLNLWGELVRNGLYAKSQAKVDIESGLDANVLSEIEKTSQAKIETNNAETNITENDSSVILDAPKNFISVGGSDFIVLKWDAVAGSEWYDIDADGEIITSGTTSYVHTKLIFGTEHKYKVRAKSTFGIGEWSDVIVQNTSKIAETDNSEDISNKQAIESNNINLVSELSIPTNITSIGNNNSIILSWDNVEAAEGYEVEVDGSIISTATTSYTHANLSSNTEHQYRVRALNSLGVGAWSNLIIQRTAGVKDVWVKESKMPKALGVNKAVILDDNIYVMGDNSLLKFDPRTATWISKKNMNTERTKFDAVAAGGKIYVIGGLSNNKYSNIVEEYDPITDIWTTKSTMPTARTGVAVSEVNGIIYTIGGYNGNEYLNIVEEYDPVIDRWTARKPMSTARAYLGTTKVNGKVYAIGGYNGNQYLNTVEEYNPITDAWIAKSSMITVRGDLGLEAINGKIYAVDGRNSVSSSINTIEEYDVVSDTWFIKGNLPISRYGIGTAVYNNKMYIIGGQGDGIIQNVEEYDPTINTYTASETIKSEKLAAGATINNFVAVQENLLNVPKNITSIGNNNSVILKWDAVVGAASYEVEVDGEIKSTTSTMYTHSGLTLDTQHKYRIRSKNTVGVSEWSELVVQRTAEAAAAGDWVREGTTPAGVTINKAVVIDDSIYALGSNSALYKYDTQTASWSTKKSMNTVRTNLVLVVANGKLYAIGGYANSKYLNTVEEYDPISDTWTTKTNMPTARRDLGVTEVNGKIYAIGGYNVSKYLNIVEEYDPITDTWTTKASMPTARGNIGVAAVKGKIYAIGGNGPNNFNIVEEYDVTLDKWSVKGSLSIARNNFGTAVINNKIYVIGGYSYNNSSSGSAIQKVEEYDPISNTYIASASMLTAKYNIGVVTFGEKIYAVGAGTIEALVFAVPENIAATPTNIISIGSNNSVILKWDAVVGAASYEVEVDGEIKSTTLTTYTHSGLILDTEHKYRVRAKNPAGVSEWSELVIQRTAEAVAKGGWVREATTPTGININEAVVVDDSIYALGSNSVLYKYEPKTATWETKKSMSTVRTNLGLVSVNGKIYAIGGYVNSKYLNIVEEYDPITDKWTTKANMPTERSYLGVTEVNGKIYAIGGYNVSKYLNIVEEYDPITDTWTTKASMPTARRDIGVAAVNGKIYAVGGYNLNYFNIVEEYDVTLDKWNVKGNLSISRNNIGIALANNKIYVIGGYASSYPYNGRVIENVEEYDPITNTYIASASMLTAKSNIGAVTIGNKIYIIGGGTVESLVFSLPENIPNVPANLSSIGSDNSILLKWDNVIGAASYEVEVDGVIKPWTSTTFTHSGLTIDTEHKYRVRSKNAAGVSEWSDFAVQKTAEVAVECLWKKETVTPTALNRNVAVELDGNIYVLNDKAVYKYDTETANWSIKKNMNISRANFGAIAVNGKIYVVGGYANKQYLNSVEEYDPETDTWVIKSNMPTARQELGMSALNGKIYAIGGYNGGKQLATVEEYDPDTDTWITKSNMNVARSGLGVIAVNETIYAIGGLNGIYQSVIEEYNPITDSWSIKGNLSTPRVYFGISLYNDRIYIIGGLNATNTSILKVEEYNPANNTYTSSTNMIAAKTKMGTATVNNKIYVIGSNDVDVLVFNNQEGILNTPANLSSFARNNTITLTWTKVNGATGYEVEADGKVISTSSSTYTHTGLSIGSEHKYRVRAKNTYGFGEWTDFIVQSTARVTTVGTWVKECVTPTALTVNEAVIIGEDIYVIGDNSLFKYNPETGTWTTKKSMNTARTSLGVVAVNEKIYAIGGRDNNGVYLSTVEEYNPGTDTWITKANMPTPRSTLGVTALNGKIFAIGGINSSKNLSTVEEYDPITNTWLVKSSMLTARSGLGVTTVNGMIYALDGWNGTSRTNIIEEYDVILNKWTKKGNMTSLRNVIGIEAYNNKIYVIGGFDGSVTTNTVEEYDPIHNTYILGSKLLYARKNMGVVALDNKLYVIGGGNNSIESIKLDTTVQTLQAPKNLITTGTNNSIIINWGSVQYAESYDVEIDGAVAANVTGISYTHTNLASNTEHRYRIRSKNLSGVSEWSEEIRQYTANMEPVKGQWMNASDMLTSKSGIGAVTVNGKIYAISGTAAGTLEEYNAETNTWIAKTNMSVKRENAAITEMNGKMYVIGGNVSTKYYNTVEEYDPITDKWTTKASMSKARNYLSVTVVNGKMYAVGGYDGSKYLNLVEEYDPVADKWTIKADMPTARGSFVIGVVNNLLYAIDGTTGTGNTNIIEEYNPETNKWIQKGMLLTGRKNAAAVVVNNSIYVIGGTTNSDYKGALNTTEVYNPQYNTCVKWDNITSSRSELGATTLNNKIYIVGGKDKNGFELRNVEAFVLADAGNKPLTPQNIVCIGTSDSIILNWDLSSGAKNYDIEVDGKIIENLTNTSYTHSGLDTNSTHKYRIRSKNISGVSEWSKEIIQNTANVNAITGGWMKASDMSTSKYGIGAVVVNDKIYALSGTATGTLEEYNPETNTWIVKTSMSVKRENAAITVVNGKIYVIGGKSNSKYLNTIEEYDPSTDKWTTKADMPTARAGLSAATANGKIYAVGGYAGNKYLNIVEEYDPISDKWTTKTNMPTARAYLGTGVLNNKIYAIDGVDGIGSNTNIIEEYDPSVDKWIKKGIMLLSRKDVAVTVANNSIYVIGGTLTNDYKGALNIVEVYNPQDNTCIKADNMQAVRSELGAVTINNKIYVIGGRDKSGVELKSADIFVMAVVGNRPAVPENIVSIGTDNSVMLNWDAVVGAKSYDLEVDGVVISNLTNTSYTHSPLEANSRHQYRVRAKNVAGVGEWSTIITQTTVDVASELTGKWVNKADMTYGRVGVGTTTIGGKIYAIGGFTDNYVGIVEEYDPVTNTWSRKNDMPTARGYHGIALVKGKIYAIGGYDVNAATNIVEEYDPSADTWVRKVDMPTARGELSISIVNDKIYAIGGYNGSYLNVVEEYDPATNSWKTMNAMPTSRSALATTVLNGEIYAIDGYNDNYLNVVEIFNPSTNAWRYKGILPLARKNVSAFTLNNKIFILGGQNTSSLNIMEEYDPYKNICTREASMGTARFSFGLVSLNGKVYAIGGRDKNSLNKVEQFTLNLSINEQAKMGQSGTNPVTGNFSRSYTDMSLDTVGFKVNLSRTYNSGDQSDTNILGKGWRFGFESSITSENNNTIKSVKLPNGSVQAFYEDARGICTAINSRSNLVKQPDGSYILNTTDQYSYGFNGKGLLQWMKDKNGNTVTINFDAAGLISSIGYGNNKQITVTYNEKGKIKSITDPLGRTVTYEYENDLLVKAIDPMGNCTRYIYDSQGYLSEIRDNESNLLESIAYDNRSDEIIRKVLSTTDRLGNTKTYSYDSQSKKSTITDSNGREAISWYDDSLTMIKTQNYEGKTTIIEYYKEKNGINRFNEEKSIIDVNGNKTEFIRDERGNITQRINPDGSIKYFSYDDKNNLIMEKDESGKITYYVYDAQKKNLLKRVQPLNGTDSYTDGMDESKYVITQYIYYTEEECIKLGLKARGLLKTLKDPEGNVTSYTYDAEGNQITITSPEGNTTTYGYNNINWKTSQTSAMGNVSQNVYNNNGNIEKTSLNNDKITRTVYDYAGRLVKQISPNQYDSAKDDINNHKYNADEGHRYTYYSNGMLKTKVDAENNVINFSYDIYGNTITQSMNNGTVYFYQYDVMNRLIKTSFKDSSRDIPVLLEENIYEVKNGKTIKTNKKYLNASEVAITTYTYDYANRLIEQVNQDGGKISIAYNANGTQNSITDANGNATYFKYDGLNRVTEQWKPLETVNGTTYYSYFKIEYDKAGRKIKEYIGKDKVLKDAVAANCIVKNNEYYKDGKLKIESDSSGRKVEYTYDKDGNVATQTVKVDENTNQITEYVNNDIGKPIEVKIHVRAGDLNGNDFSSNTDIVETTSYSYDKQGNIKTVKTHNGVVTTYEYDKLGRQLKVSQPGVDEYDKAITISNTKTYDYAGRVLTSIDANNKTTKYVYDTRGNLVNVINSKGDISAFYYDNAGRKIAEVSPENYDKNKTLSEMNRNEYTYDLMGRLKAKTVYYFDSASGKWISTVTKAFKYDINGNVIKEIDAIGYDTAAGSTIDEKINSAYGTSYTYNAANALVTVLDPVSMEKGLAFSAKYSYDGARRKIAETDASGKSILYYYDDAGKLISASVKKLETEPEVKISSATYNLVGNKVTTKEGNGAIVTYEYNSFGKVKKVTYPGDSSIQAYYVIYQYDDMGRLVRKQDSLGVVDLYAYDKQGREVSHTQQKADGSEAIAATVKYDTRGNKRFETDANGNIKENTYDDLNRLIYSTMAVTNGDGKKVNETTVITYDADGRVLTSMDWRGNTTTYIYDGLGRVIEKKDAYDVTIEKLEYNINGSQTKAYDALGNLTQFSYDKNNRLIKTVDPEGHESTQHYDNVGNINEKTDGNNNITSYTFDEFNRVVAVKDSKGEVTSYTYDLNSNMLTQTDGQGNVTTFEYNVANKLIRKIDHGGRTGTAGNYSYESSKTETYTYYSNGRLKSKVDRSGTETTYTYDIHGNMLTEVVGYLSISYTYDKKGNQLTITDATGTTERTYDELNRVISKTVPSIGKSIYKYDITSNVGGMEYGFVAEISIDPKGNETTKVYDRVGRLKRVIADGDVTTYSYYDNGALKSVVYSNGYKEEYTYYKDRQIKTLTNQKADGTVIESFAYTYDAAHNMIAKVDVKGTTTYEYDELSRLKVVTEPSGKITTYSYDKAGNRATETIKEGENTVVKKYSYNSQNRLDSVVTELNGIMVDRTTYAYDSKGNQLSSTSIAYVDGKEQAPTQTVNKYDDLNQLIETTTAEGTKIVNIYNGEGIRVAKEVNGKLTRYLYEADKVVLELDDKGNEKARNVYGTNQVSRTIDGKKAYYFYNNHGDVTKLISTKGEILNSYYYDAFGNVVDISETIDNPYRYAGYQYDSETKTYYIMCRMYDPRTARFLQEDTYRGDINDPLSLNLYTYCVNNPVKYVDPTGHWSILSGIATAITEAITQSPSIAAAVGATISAVENFITGLGQSNNSNVAETSSDDYSEPDNSSNEVSSNSQGSYSGSNIGSNNSEKPTNMIDNAWNSIKSSSSWLQSNSLKMQIYSNRVVADLRDASDGGGGNSGEVYGPPVPDNQGMSNPIQANSDITEGDLRVAAKVLSNNPPVAAGVGLGIISVAASDPVILNTSEIGYKGNERSNPETYYTYTELKKYIKESGLSGSVKGLEAHHLLEKQFADVFDVNKDDIISVALTPQWHRNVNSAMGNNIDNLINSEIDRILTDTGKSSAGVQEIWEAHRNVYEKIGQSDWAQSIYEAYVKKFNVEYK